MPHPSRLSHCLMIDKDEAVEMRPSESSMRHVSCAGRGQDSTIAWRIAGVGVARVEIDGPARPHLARSPAPSETARLRFRTESLSFSLKQVNRILLLHVEVVRNGLRNVCDCAGTDAAEHAQRMPPRESGVL